MGTDAEDQSTSGPFLILYLGNDVKAHKTPPRCLIITSMELKLPDRC